MIILPSDSHVLSDCITDRPVWNFSWHTVESAIKVVLLSPLRILWRVVRFDGV